MAKIKRKFNWLDYWDFEAQEAWFRDMALKGYQLESTNNFFSSFKKTEPQDVIYRCDIFKKNSYEQERKEFYESAGWDYVDSREHVHIFKKTEDDGVQELHTDPYEQANIISLLKRSLYIRGGLTLLLSIIIISISYHLVSINPILNYLDDRLVDQFIIMVVYLLVSFYVISGMVHVRRLKNRLKSGKLPRKDVHYKKRKRFNQVVQGSVIFVLFYWVFMSWFSLINTVKADRHPPIPDEELPVVQLEDFMEDEFEQIDNGNPGSYYKVDSSLLVPHQYELVHKVKVPGEEWEDESGVYEPAIHSFKYEVLNEFFANRFVENLKNETLYPNDRYEEINHHQFDELWINRNTRDSFIARDDRVIYYVTYYGKEPIDNVIEKVFD